MIKMMYKNIVSNGLKAIPTHVALKESAQLRKIGFVKISGLIKTGLSSVLEQDAIASVEKSRLVGDGQMTSLEKNAQKTTSYQFARRSRSTNVLMQFQISLLPLLRTLTGNILVPSDSWYIYYEKTDEISLHVDPKESDISVLISVLGEVGPLHLHPELEGQDQNQLDSYYQGADWNPIGGIPLKYPCDGIIINRGHKIPHHRAGKPISQLCAVAALHYTV
ncbi:MAG: hypothetical protein ITD42_02565 [Nitrosospira sp.]|nr:hypothetical protein [Nitrosospira sp.]